MTHPDPQSKICQGVCWTLSIFAGVGTAASVSIHYPNMLGLLAGLVVAGGGAVFLQSKICGIARSDWGPFNGLKVFLDDGSDDGAQGSKDPGGQP